MKKEGPDGKSGPSITADSGANQTATQCSHARPVASEKNLERSRFHIKWYKRYPNDALTGMASLTLEERGAYNTVLDLIYVHGGAADDDDKFIAGWLRVDVRVWKRIRRRLIENGKLYANGPTLRNARADREVDAAQHRYLSASEAGVSSASKRRSTLNILKGLPPTAAGRSVELTRTKNKNLTTSLQSTTPPARANDDDDGSSDEEKAQTASPYLLASEQRRRERLQ
jgi:uncharacterized protein YdaU (DUF1376 family)